MLGDYNVVEFELKWKKLVVDFRLEENNWVSDLYEKRNIWATTYIRSNFFASFRTTSRCESMHVEFGRYVGNKNNLEEFLHHFFRCLNYMRYKEAKLDFTSYHGEPVLQT